MENARPPASWKDLFAAKSGSPTLAFNFLSVKRLGHPLVIIKQGSPVGPALSLYAAQTPFARLAKSIWRLTLPLGVAPGLRRETVSVDRADPFLEFLRTISNTQTTPHFSVLAGNPTEPSRRFLLVPFDSAGQPVAVVKAGTRPEAVDLIRKETLFLEFIPKGTPAIPKVRHRFESEAVTAFALDYFPGRSPRPTEGDRMLALLEQWLQRDRAVPLNQLQPWQRLERCAGSDPLFSKLANTLSGRPIRPALFHGDFAPWNIKVAPNGSPTVLDWDRGLAEGVPGWDWFHYVLQPAILVERMSVAALARVVERLLNQPRFHRYCADAGLAGVEREWLLAYLLHCQYVLQPAEGSPKIPELLALHRFRNTAG